jgi:hypothetical protein
MPECEDRPEWHYFKAFQSGTISQLESYSRQDRTAKACRLKAELHTVSADLNSGSRSRCLQPLFLLLALSLLVLPKFRYLGKQRIIFCFLVAGPVIATWVFTIRDFTGFIAWRLD